MYSQNKNPAEDEFIWKYFQERDITTGRLLDIGANDGITLSNSRLFIERGWHADLVEPSPSAFHKLRNCVLPYTRSSQLPYWSMNNKISLYNFAITETTGEVDWYESDWHLKKTDSALLSTASVEHAEKWKHHKRLDGSQQGFQKTQVKSYRWEDSPLSAKQYDYITIDTEGHNWTVLQQIPLHGVQALCVEWANDQKYLTLMTDYAARFGLKEAQRNFENVIFVR